MVKTYVDFYTKCYVLLVATGISRVLGCFKSRYYYSCVQVKNDHVQALVAERPINVSDSITEYNGGLLPDIILLTQGYYRRGTRLNAMLRFCLYSL